MLVFIFQACLPFSPPYIPLVRVNNDSSQNVDNADDVLNIFYLFTILRKHFSATSLKIRRRDFRKKINN